MGKIKARLKFPDEDIIVHIFKVRKGSEIYRLVVCGSRYQAEQYIKHELKADDIEWVKTIITEPNEPFKLGKRNKIIAREGFILRMEFMCNYGKAKNKPLVDKQKKIINHEDNEEGKTL